VLGNPKASQQIFNISGAKYVTFDGLARACAKVTKFISPRNGNDAGFSLSLNSECLLLPVLCHCQ
jgi:hypothetical protein